MKLKPRKVTREELDDLIKFLEEKYEAGALAGIGHECDLIRNDKGEIDYGNMSIEIEIENVYRVVKPRRRFKR